MLNKIILSGLFFLISSPLALATVKLSVSGLDSPLVSAGAGKKPVKVIITGSVGLLEVKGQFSAHGKPDAVKETKTVKGQNDVILEFDFPMIGYYDITVVAHNGRNEVAKTMSNYAVVPDNRYDHPREMGTCTHFAQGKGAYPLTFNLLKLAGFTRIRDDFSWQAIEPKPKKYHIPERIEKLVNTAARYKIKPLLVTGYCTTAYKGKYKKNFVTTPETIDAYANAVAYAVKHFGKRVMQWELWNEPNVAHPIKDYLPMLKVVYPKAKKANPKATFISCGGGGAGGGPGGGMIIPIVEAGGVNFQDGFSIHPYMVPFDPDYGYGANGGPYARVNISGYSNFLRGFINHNLKKNHRKLSLWVTEIGWPVDMISKGHSRMTPITQAAYLARTYLLSRKENLAKGVFWYDFQNDGINPKNKEHNFGIIRKDYSPKPAYQAAAVVAWILRNRPFIREIKLRSSCKHCKAYVYGQGKDQVIAVWADAQNVPEGYTEKAIFNLPFYGGKAILVNWDGSKSKPRYKNYTVAVNAGILPQYIIQKGN